MEHKLKQEQEFQAACNRGLEYANLLGLSDLFGTPPEQIKPPIYLKIQYGDDRFVYKGNVLNNADVEEKPQVSFKEYSYEDRYYALVMTDPDAPARDEPTFREYVHWVQVNIPGSAGESAGEAGELILAYNGSAPPYNSGVHRYIFLLFEQKNKLTEAEITSSKEYFANRGGLSVSQWATQMQMGLPVGVNGFLAEWDEYCDYSHKELYPFSPPAKYHSPSQQAEFLAKKAAAEEEEQRRRAAANNDAKDISSDGSHLRPDIAFLVNNHPQLFSGGKTTRRLCTKMAGSDRIGSCLSD